MLSDNIFQGDTYSLACLGILNAYLLGIIAICSQIFHTLINVSLITVDQHLLKAQLRIYNLIPLCQGIFQIIVLCGYFLFSESNLPDVAIAGAVCILFCLLINLGLQIYFQVKLNSIISHKKLYLKTVCRILILRSINMLVGIIVGSVFLA